MTVKAAGGRILCVARQKHRRKSKAARILNIFLLILKVSSYPIGFYIAPGKSIARPAGKEPQRKARLSKSF